MSETASREQFTFQAEIKQLLHLLSHSLYQSREIAIRELVSNASDALDKMRFVAMTDESQRDDVPLGIVLEGIPDSGELVIRDNGVGMTRDELVTNLGTIAHSGSMEFLKNASTSGKAGPLADRPVRRRVLLGLHAGRLGPGPVAGATSDRIGLGVGVGRVGVVHGSRRRRAWPGGPRSILHLKDDAKEFAQPYRIKNGLEDLFRLRAASDHRGRRRGQRPEADLGRAQRASHRRTARPVLPVPDPPRPTRSPLWQIHMSIDSPIQFRAILYCPKVNVERLGFGRLEHGLNLCAKRILVQGDCRDLLPEYLRFLHGLVDSEDLPLNVSRETLQDNSVIRKIRTVLTKERPRQADGKLAVEEKPEQYLDFYKQFGPTLKEGIAVDPSNRDRVAKLLRFASSRLRGWLGRDRPRRLHRPGAPPTRRPSTTWADPTSPRSARAPTSRSSASGASKSST